MKLLLCSRHPLSKELGAPKVLIELAEAVRKVGGECDLVGPDETGAGASRPDSLREYLRKNCARYDVVDYDHEDLPFSRGNFPLSTLFVARSVLLIHHLGSICLPRARGLRPKLGRLVYGRSREAALQRRIQVATRTVAEADLINVSNDDDKAELLRRGVSPDKVVVIPYGIDDERRALFEAVPPKLPEKSIVVFVGTFDYRKGASDFAEILQGILNLVPEARLRLLGTKGLFVTNEEVLAFFPNRMREKIEIVPKFLPTELPRLLADCSVGIFPSYLEGFGFGVLEMLAAAVPVIAYAAPGPSMMLGSQNLVSPGQTGEMAAKVAALLRNPKKLAAARAAAQEASRAFCWPRIATMTMDIYEQRARFRRQAMGFASH